MNSLLSGVDAHFAIKDEKGLEMQILPLSGDFQDSGNALQFNSGKVSILLDDDSCNQALEPQDIKDGIFDRNLIHSQANSMANTKKSEHSCK